MIIFIACHSRGTASAIQPLTHSICINHHQAWKFYEEESNSKIIKSSPISLQHSQFSCMEFTLVSHKRPTKLELSPFARLMLIYLSTGNRKFKLTLTQSPSQSLLRKKKSASSKMSAISYSTSRKKSCRMVIFGKTFSNKQHRAHLYPPKHTQAQARRRGELERSIFIMVFPVLSISICACSIRQRDLYSTKLTLRASGGIEHISALLLFFLFHFLDNVAS